MSSTSGRPVSANRVEVREAEPSDAAAVREVARRSLQASYSLSPGVIERAVEQWYAADAFAEELAGPDVLVLVAVRDDEVAGYTESALVDDASAGDVGDIRWLHVSPDHRGRGIGSRLFERTREELAERADHLRGTVLAHNREGNTFYERHGFEKAGEETVEIGGETYVENVYVETPDAEGRPTVVAGPDDARLFVDRSDPERGSRAPFHVVYTELDGENRYGYLCGNCEALANAMDPMGRIECGDCGNTRKPTRWDAAYL